MANFQFVKEFADRNSSDWPNISGAQETTTVSKNAILASVFSESAIPPFSSDVDLVVFGSIARNECSKNSDIDWTILVDGQASPEHYELSHIVRARLEKTGLQEPGTTGMFGQITFSHDLIHYIGGEEDTNHNISRRLLLLLESDKILFDSSEQRNGTSYDRVLMGIINQYIRHDSSYASDRGSYAKVPRFLLNDFIRFWRTMCVDFAYKQKEQKGKKWALRNIKLRMSRKLIYVKGLLMCYSCYNNENLTTETINEHLRNLAIMKPLDVVIKVLCEKGTDENEICNLFNAYDAFLGILDNEKERQHLSKLNMLKVYQDEDFMKARSISDKFQKALTNIFINNDNDLNKFILTYGIF